MITDDIDRNSMLQPQVPYEQNQYATNPVPSTDHFLDKSQIHSGGIQDDLSANNNIPHTSVQDNNTSYVAHTEDGMAQNNYDSPEPRR